MGRRLLILGGTAEARALAQRLSTSQPSTSQLSTSQPSTREFGTSTTGTRIEVVSSLAGRIAEPQLPMGEVRVGGFGGVPGLIRYLRDQRIGAVVDATHPFAAQMTAHAAQACGVRGVPLLILDRPAWEPVDGDRWTVVPGLNAAADAVPQLVNPDGRVLLTIGRQGVASFADLPQRFWIRALEEPEPPRPRRAEVILERGPFTTGSERELLQRLAIDLLVSKNSGGPMTSAKLEAAREAHLPVLMIARPPLPDGVHTTQSIDEALHWIHGVLPS